MSRSKKPVQIRHGDVLLNPVATIPASAIDKTPVGPVILAYGEATGHHHAVAVKTPGSVKFLWDGERRYLQVKHDTVLDHPEHGPVPVVAGTYEVLQQREYSLADEWHAVLD